MPNTAVPNAVEPKTRVLTAAAIFTAKVVRLPIGLVAKVVAILLVKPYNAIAIAPDTIAPVKQRRGLGRVFTGSGLFSAIILGSMGRGGEGGKGEIITIN